MRRILLTVALLAAPLMAHADDPAADTPPNAVAKYLYAEQAEHDGAIARLEAELAAVKKSTSKDKAKRRKELEAAIKRAKTRPEVYTPFLRAPLKLEAVGVIEGKTYHVVRVIDEDEVAAKVVVVKSIKQIDNLTQDVQTEEATVILRGIDTAGVVDGAAAESPGALEVVGTDKHAGKTVFVLSPISQEDLATWRPKLRERK